MPSAKKPASAPPASAERQVAGFIAKFAPKVARHIRAVRRVLRAHFPTANELVYDNYNFLVIAYASGERASSAMLSIAADLHGVQLMFLWGSKLPDPKRLLQGTGAQNRSLRVDDVAMLKRAGVLALLDAAAAYVTPPLREAGKRATIVKLISRKQRPRR